MKYILMKLKKDIYSTDIYIYIYISCIYTHIYMIIHTYIYIYGIQHWRIFRSTYVKMH